MAVDGALAMRACERVFGRLCELGTSVGEGTPAAGFLAAAARRVERARARLTAGELPERALVELTAAARLLDDVADLGGRDTLSGLERLSVLVDGLCVTLDVDDADDGRSHGSEQSE